MAIYSLEAKYYTDAAIFKQEQGNLLSSTWQFACHGSSVGEVGSYVCCEIAGENIFVIRGRDKKVRAFYNVCKHRGHELLKGSGKNAVIACPYHAWVYELSGELRSAPNMKAVEDFEKETIRLTEIKAEEFVGFIFVNLDANAKPMDEWFPKVREQLQEWLPNWQELKPLQWVEVPEKCNWKVSIENYSECYHCALNHPTFSTGVVKPETYDIQPQGKCLRHTTKCQDLKNMTYDINSGFKHFDEYSSWFLFPLFSFQIYPGNVLNTYHWRPVDEGKVTLWRGWYSKGGEENQAVRKLAVQDRKTTVEEDIHLVESVQRGLSSKGYQPGPLIVDPKGGVNSEHPIMHLQNWVREFTAE